MMRYAHVVSRHIHRHQIRHRTTMHRQIMQHSRHSSTDSRRAVHRHSLTDSRRATHRDSSTDSHRDSSMDSHRDSSTDSHRAAHSRRRLITSHSR